MTAAIASIGYPSALEQASAVARARDNPDMMGSSQRFALPMRGPASGLGEHLDTDSANRLQTDRVPASESGLRRMSRRCCAPSRVATTGSRRRYAVLAQEDRAFGGMRSGRDARTLPRRQAVSRASGSAHDAVRGGGSTRQRRRGSRRFRQVRAKSRLSEPVVERPLTHRHSTLFRDQEHAPAAWLRPCGSQVEASRRRGNAILRFLLCSCICKSMIQLA